LLSQVVRLAGHRQVSSVLLVQAFHQAVVDRKEE
jgi:hypothetical protein